MENNFYLCTRKVPVMSTIASRCTIKRRIWSLREISATFFITFVSENPKAVVPQRHENPHRQRPRPQHPGKRSPDGTFLEAIYNREIAKRIVAELQNKGYDAELLVPEEEDISLNERYHDSSGNRYRPDNDQ